MLYVKWISFFELRHYQISNTELLLSSTLHLYLNSKVKCSSRVVAKKCIYMIRYQKKNINKHLDPFWNKALFQSSLLWFNHLSTNLERFREDNCYSIIENTFTKHQRVKRHIHVQVTKTLIDWLLFHSNFNFSVQ